MFNIAKTYGLHLPTFSWPQTHTSRPLATLAAVAKTTAVQKSPNPSRTSAFNTTTSLTTWLPIIVNLPGLKPVAVVPQRCTKPNMESQRPLPTAGHMYVVEVLCPALQALLQHWSLLVHVNQKAMSLTWAGTGQPGLWCPLNGLQKNTVSKNPKFIQTISPPVKRKTIRTTFASSSHNQSATKQRKTPCLCNWMALMP